LIQLVLFPVERRLLGLTDPGGSEWAYTYDMRGSRLTAADPDLGLSYTYDVAGRLASQRDARNLVTTLLYDPLNRVYSKNTVRPNGNSDNVVSVYDQARSGFYNKGQLTTSARIVAGVYTGIKTFDYDGEGRLTKEVFTVDGTAYNPLWSVHAPGGEILYRVFPDLDQVGSSTTPFTYDAYGRPYSVPDVVTSTTYEADGQTLLIGYANGVGTGFNYNPQRRWLNAILTLKGTTELQDLVYTRDNLGRITAVVSGTDRGTWNYTYDNLDRLTFANNIGHDTLDQSFTYALNGNMTYNLKLGTFTLSRRRRCPPACPALDERCAWPLGPHVSLRLKRQRHLERRRPNLFLGRRKPPARRNRRRLHLRPRRQPAEEDPGLARHTNPLFRPNHLLRVAMAEPMTL
jgi:YD repeat-containing protein